MKYFDGGERLRKKKGVSSKKGMAKAEAVEGGNAPQTAKRAGAKAGATSSPKKRRPGVFRNTGPIYRRRAGR